MLPEETFSGRSVWHQLDQAVWAKPELQMHDANPQSFRGLSFSHACLIIWVYYSLNNLFGAKIIFSEFTETNSEFMNNTKSVAVITV